jgi:hypothetical protein
VGRTLLPGLFLLLGGVLAWEPFWDGESAIAAAILAAALGIAALLVLRLRPTANATAH